MGDLGLVLVLLLSMLYSLSFAIILMGRRELVAFLKLSSFVLLLSTLYPLSFAIILMGRREMVALL